MQVTGFAPDGEQYYFTTDNYACAMVLVNALRLAGWTGCDIVC